MVSSHSVKYWLMLCQSVILMQKLPFGITIWHPGNDDSCVSDCVLAWLQLWKHCSLVDSDTKSIFQWYQHNSTPLYLLLLLKHKGIIEDIREMLFLLLRMWLFELWTSKTKTVSLLYCGCSINAPLWPISSLQCFHFTFWYHLSEHGIPKKVIPKKYRVWSTFYVWWKTKKRQVELSWASSMLKDKWIRVRHKNFRIRLIEKSKYSEQIK